MATENDVMKQSQAKIVFGTLCSMLDKRGWKYERDDEKYVVRTGVTNEAGQNMKLYIKVDADRSVMYLKSPLPFKVEPSRIDEFCKALTVANWKMLNGCFEMDADDGYVGFKLCIAYIESIVGERLCKYMVDISCNMLGAFMPKLAALAEGSITLERFVALANEAI